MTILRSLLLALLILTTTPAFGESPRTGPQPDASDICGLNAPWLDLARSRSEARLRNPERPPGVVATSAPFVFQAGDIAVMEDDRDELVDSANPFDLKRRGMQYLRRPKGMSVVRSALGFKQLIGDRIELSDAGSHLVRFPDGFEFPFGDQVHRRVWINANGNLTFGQPDGPGTSRFDFLNGPQRIAPLMTDLDPGLVPPGGGVYVNFLQGRLRVTWLDVPESFEGNVNTFQVTLFADTGRVTFAYTDDVDASFAVVGVKAFDEGAPAEIDYNEELPFRPPQKIAVFEEFISFPLSNPIAILDTFYDNFQDDYDQVVIWLDFEEAPFGPLPFGFPFQNDVDGIGLNLFDISFVVGSDQLKVMAHMGTLSRYPDDPSVDIPSVLPTLRTFSSMEILGHVVGHQWLAFPRFADATGNLSEALLNVPGGTHWSFFLHSQGSVLYGNDWRDNGGGSFQSTSAATSRYSELDQYLMGLRSPGEVADFFLIENADAFPSFALPEVGATVQGDRVDVSVGDVIAAEGPRDPSSAVAPSTFRIAFVLVGLSGQTVSQASIDKVDAFRQAFEDWFQQATDSRGQVDTTLLSR